MRRYLRHYRPFWWREQRIWEVSKADPDGVQRLRAPLRLSPLTAKVLWARNIRTPHEARLFLLGTGKDLSEPTAVPGVAAAAEKLVAAVMEKRPILVHGDYDADGISATALLASTLAQWGGIVSWFLPNRHQDGYGVSERAIKMAKQKGIQVLVTVDCGTGAHAAIELAKKSGMTVIVIDHHEPPEQLAPADVIVNPKASEAGAPWRDLCAAGLALKVAQTVAEKLRKRPVAVTDLPVELAAIATAADVVPLVGENRLIVREGLATLRSARHLGLRTLMEVARVNPASVRSFHLGFIIAPRLNAVGRMIDPKPAIKLLLTTNPSEARDLATQLDKENRRRQQEEEKTLSMAVEMVEKELDLTRERVIVLASPEWHPGVIGIVAARLLELYGRPTFLIALRGGEGKGSARSTERFPVSDALKACRPLLVNGGGHKAAGGFTIRSEHIPHFREHLLTLAEEWMTEEDLLRRIRVDAEVTTREVTLETVKELEALEPIGYGNPKPVFLLRNAKLLYANKVPSYSGHRLVIRVQQGERVLELVGEGMSDALADLSVGIPIHVCFTAEVKTEGAIPVLDLQIVDLCPAGSEKVILREVT